MRAHPAADIFPMMTDAEIATLADDIKRHGQSLAITTITEDGETLILDGRNRARACELAGVEPRTIAFGGEDPFAFVASANLQRRHLSVSQKAMIAAEIARLKNGSNQHRKEGLSRDKASESKTIAEAAAIMGVSAESVVRARKVRERGAPELQAAVVDGRLAVKTAALLATLPHEEQVRRIEDAALRDAEEPSCPPPPSSLPRLIERDGKPMKEGRSGVLRVVDPGREIPKNNPKLHTQKHERVKALAAEGLGPAAIAKETGYTIHFVNSSLTKFVRAPKGVLEGAILDAQTFADTWRARAAEDVPRWLAASADERQELADALEECARAARKMINRLNKEAEKERNAS